MAYSKSTDVLRLGDDYESITVTGTAIGCTTAKAIKAERALVTVEAGQIRFRYDGGDPTSTEGHLASSGDTWIIEGTEDIKQFRAIRADTSDSTLRVTYEV